MVRNRGHGHDRSHANVRQVLITLCAFALVFLVVPLAFGLGNVINTSFGVSNAKKILHDVDWSNTTMWAASFGSAFTYHLNVTNVPAKDEQVVYTGEALDTNFNELVIDYVVATESATRQTILMLFTNVTTTWMIEHHIVAVSVSMNSSSDKTLDLYGEVTDAYKEYDNTVQSVWGMGYQAVKDDGHVDYAAVPCHVFEDYSDNASYVTDSTHPHNVQVNLSNDRWTTAFLDVDAVSLLRADTYLESQDNTTFQIALTITGNTDATSIVIGDAFKVKIEFWSSVINQFDLSSMIVFGLGFGLIIMAVYCTPYANTGGRRRHD